MSTTLAVKIRPQFQWVYNSEDDLATAVDSGTLGEQLSLANGAGAGQANCVWRQRRILTAASGVDLLDLNGAMSDRFGNSLVFTIIKAIYIANLGTPDGSGGWDLITGHDLLIGGAASGCWAAMFDDSATAKLRLRVGGTFTLTAPTDGYIVTAGSADILKVAWDGNPASGLSTEYDIAIVGVV